MTGNDAVGGALFTIAVLIAIAAAIYRVLPMPKFSEFLRHQKRERDSKRLWATRRRSGSDLGG
jgi:hypothetical protein